MSSAPNPYTPTQLPPPAPETPKGKEPFSHQAAKFSLYAPFVLMVAGFMMRSVLGTGEQAERNVQSGSALQIEIAVGLIQLVTTLAAFVFGFVGVVGGIQRRAGWTIAMAIGGILLNGLILAFSALAVFIILGRHWAP